MTEPVDSPRSTQNERPTPYGLPVSFGAILAGVDAYHRYRSEQHRPPQPISDNEVAVILAAAHEGRLQEVAHAAWHLLDESGESDTEGLLYVAARDHQRLSDALDAAGWTAESHADGEWPMDERSSP